MKPKEFLKVDISQQPVIQAARLTERTVFTDPRIRVWRKLKDRENCTMDVDLPDGNTILLHIKRYPRRDRNPTPAEVEVRGYHALYAEKIPTAQMVAFGKEKEGKSFTIFANLDGYTPADKLIEKGFSFERILNPTADVAAQLHNRRLHHRDLYLCHFMVNPDGDEIDVRLIDTARVDRLMSVLTRKRWIVKDLAQFWYSMTKLPITPQQRERWLARYAEQRQLKASDFQHAIDRKVAAIAQHDARLNKKQPNRNISIPD